MAPDRLPAPHAARSRASGGLGSASPRRGRSRSAPALAALAGLAVSLLGLGFTSPAAANEWELGVLHVELMPGVQIETINERYGTTTLDTLPPLYRIDLPPGADELQYILMMLADPDIADAEYAYTNETPEGTRQMIVAVVGGTIEEYLDQNLVERIHLAAAHQRSTGEGVLIAVLDTGVAMDHPALEGAIAPGGWDFVDDDDDPTDSANGIDDDGDDLIDEGAGHGTMVAGIIHLVAPDAQILPIRVLDDEGRGSTFSVAQGIRYAVEQGAHVLNFSLGLRSDCNTLLREVTEASHAGAVMVGAAGNDDENQGLYPARDPNVFMVTALDSSDVKADFSNYEPRVSISAPGVGVMAPYYDGDYAVGAGTSFAAPFIAGECALILAAQPGLDSEWLEMEVENGAVGIYHLPGNYPYDGELGSGRFDGAALLQSIPEPSATPDPVLATRTNLRVAPNPSRGGSPVGIRWSLPVGAPAPRGDAAGPAAPSPSASSREATEVTIHDASGRIVRRLERVPGTAEGRVDWDGLDAAGRRVVSGAYFVRLAGAPGSSARIVRIR